MKAQRGGRRDGLGIGAGTFRGASQRKRDRVIAGGLMVFVCMGTGRRGEVVIALGLLCVENRDVVQSASKSHP